MKFKYFLGILLAIFVSVTFLGCGAPLISTQDQTPLQTEAALAFVGAENELYNLYTAKEDGSEVKKLTDLNRVEGLVKPRWSPDGSKIVFQYRSEKGSAKIYVIKADGNNLVEITKDSEAGGEQPQWVDDSHILFLTKGKKGNDIYSVDIEGANLIKVAARTTGDFAIVPNQNELVYQDQSTLAIRKALLGAKEDKTLTSWGKLIYAPRVAPDGSRLAFISQNAKKKYTLYSFDLAKNSLGEIIPFPYFKFVQEEFELAWTSDSSRLVYLDADQKDQKSLVVLGVVDKRILPLTTEKTTDHFITTSRFQSKVIFCRDNEGTRSLIIVDLEDQGEKELITSQYNPLNSDFK